MRGLDSDILASAGKTLGIEDMAGLADYVMERVAAWRAPLGRDVRGCQNPVRTGHAK